MSKPEPTRALKGAKYSFDHEKNAWYCGKKPAAEEDVLIFLIQFAKARNIPNAGEYASASLAKAKAAPELTTRAFMRARMVRNRNRRRIAGKYLFLNWTRAVGIEIEGKLEDFMARNSLLVSRFYNEIAAGYECCKKQARIVGRSGTKKRTINTPASQQSSPKHREERPILRQREDIGSSWQKPVHSRSAAGRQHPQSSPRLLPIKNTCFYAPNHESTFIYLSNGVSVTGSD